MAGRDLARGLSSSPGGTFNQITSGLGQQFVEESQESTFEQTRGAAKVATEIGIPIAAGVMIKTAGSGLRLGNSDSADFFKGSTYSDKVLGQVKAGDYHAFPDIVRNFAGDGNVTKIIGANKQTHYQLWGFVGMKEKTKVKKGSDLDGIGDAWTFVAFERHSKLVLSWHLGRRTEADTIVFTEKLAHAARGNSQVTTDGFKPYQHAIVMSLGAQHVDFAQLVSSITKRR